MSVSAAQPPPKEDMTGSEEVLKALTETVARQGNLIQSYLEQQTVRDELLVALLEKVSKLEKSESSGQAQLDSESEPEVATITDVSNPASAAQPVATPAHSVQGIGQEKPKVWSTNRSQPVAENQQRRTRSMVAMSLMGDDVDGMPGAVSFHQFCKKEVLMWDVLKSTRFWQTLRSYLETATPLPAPCFLRMQLQMPHDMTPEELGRLFHEQDTVTLVSVVIKPVERGALDTCILLLCGLIHPTSSLRLRWDTFMMALLLSVCLVSPFVICFDVSFDHFSALGIWETVVDSAFILDMYLNFRTVCVDSHNILLDGWTSARMYAKGYFLVDLVSTVPWHVLLSSSNGALGLMQLFKIPGLMGVVEARTGRVFTRVSGLVFVVVFMLHAFACLFHFVAVVNSDRITWIESSGIVDSTSTMDRYISSMYWAMSTMATVGYGDITPIQVQEKVVSMAGMLCGVTIFAYITSTVSSLVSSFNIQSARREDRKHQLDSFCRAHRIPRNLSHKLSRYYDEVLTRRIHQDDQQMILELPKSLREQVLLTVHADVFERVPFFQGRHPQFLAQMLQHLLLEYYEPGEYVMWEGDYCTQVYFVCTGILELRARIDASGNKPALHKGMDKYMEEKKLKDRIKKLWKRQPQCLHWENTVLTTTAAANSDAPQKSLYSHATAAARSNSTSSTMIKNGDTNVDSRGVLDDRLFAHDMAVIADDGSLCGKKSGPLLDQDSSSPVAVQAVLTLLGMSGTVSNKAAVTDLLRKAQLDNSQQESQQGRARARATAHGGQDASDRSSLIYGSGNSGTHIQHGLQQLPVEESKSTSTQGSVPTLLCLDSLNSMPVLPSDIIPRLSPCDTVEATLGGGVGQDIKQTNLTTLDETQERCGDSSSSCWSTLPSERGRDLDSSSNGPQQASSLRSADRGGQSETQGHVVAREASNQDDYGCVKPLKSNRPARSIALDEHAEIRPASMSASTRNIDCRVSGLLPNPDTMSSSVRPAATMPPSLALRQQQLQQTRQAHSIVADESTCSQHLEDNLLESATEGLHSAVQSDAPQHRSVVAGPTAEGKVAPEPDSLHDSPSCSFEVTSASQNQAAPAPETVKQWVKLPEACTQRVPSRQKKAISFQPTYSLDQSCTSTSTSQDSDQPSSFSHHKNGGNFHVVERTVGIDSYPHRKIARLHSGDHFGGDTCLAGTAQNASVVTVTACELLCLHHSSLLEIIGEWPGVETDLLSSPTMRKKARAKAHNHTKRKSNRRP